MGAMASQITSLTIVYSTIHLGADQRKHQSTTKFHVTGICAGNSPVTGEFPTQMSSNVENVSIWWRHHVFDETNSRADVYFAISQCNTPMLTATHYAFWTICCHVFCPRKINLRLPHKRFITNALLKKVFQSTFNWASRIILRSSHGENRPSSS